MKAWNTVTLLGIPLDGVAPARAAMQSSGIVLVLVFALQHSSIGIREQFLEDLLSRKKAAHLYAHRLKGGGDPPESKSGSAKHRMRKKKRLYWNSINHNNSSQTEVRFALLSLLEVRCSDF